MRWRRRPAPEDPDAVAVEAFLAERATPLGDRAPRALDRLVVQGALWLCPCYSDEDAAVLLLCTSEDGEVLWSRMPDRLSMDDLVDARRYTGAHTHPATVLAWLHGRAADPGFDDADPHDLALADRLRDRLTSAAR